MNDATKAMVKVIAATFGDDIERTAKWYAKQLRCSITDMRPLIREALEAK